MKQFIDLIRDKNRFSVKAEGTSMLPVLQPGDIVYIRKIQFTRIRENDIVLVMKNNRMLIHRTIYTFCNKKKSKYYIVTRGDNNRFSDGKIYHDQVFGVAYQIKRGNKLLHVDTIYLAQSSVYFQEIIALQKAFEHEGVNYVFLKGLPLHLYLEGNHPRRLYADCDILVAEEAVGKVINILKRYNYRYIPTNPSLVNNIVCKHLTQYSFIKILSGVAVTFDIHFKSVFMFSKLGKLYRLDYKRSIDRLTSEFLKSKVTVSIQGQKFPVLDNSYKFIYFCLNIFHHNFRGCHRYKLLDRLIRKWELDYTAIQQIIIAYRLENYIYPSILMLKRNYSAEVPQGFFKDVQPKNSFNKYILSNILQHDIFSDGPVEMVGQCRFMNQLFLSPSPNFSKILEMFDSRVIFSILSVLARKVKTRKTADS